MRLSRTMPSLLGIVIASSLLAACGAPPADGDPQVPSDAPEPVADQPVDHVPPATAPPEAIGSLRVGLPAEGTITFEGFGPARFGAADEAVRMAWGGDLGDEQPSEPGGCYYLIPQPLGEDGYRVAFMIEGDRFARIDIRSDQVEAPGGGKVGMGAEQIRALYPGRVEQAAHKYDPDGSYLRVTGEGGAPGVLLFETGGDGKVDEWRIGVPPQVDYVEGCS